MAHFICSSDRMSKILKFKKRINKQIQMKTKTTQFISVGKCLAFLPLAFFFQPGQSKAQTVPKPDHVIVLMMENYNYANIIGDVTNCPYINKLAGDTMGALFTNSFAIEHPSQPNYLDLFSGSNQGITNDNVPSNIFTTANLGAELIAKSYTFTGYSEGLSSVGYNGATSGGSGGYARKHAPWANWMGASSNSIPTTDQQPYTAFPTSANYSTLPTVSFVIPNLVDDMHNGSSPSNKQTGDTWLKNNIDAYAQWAKKHNSLLVLTWDEDDNTGGTNQIVTIFIGQNVKQGQYSEKITHYRVLRTLEDMYGLGYAGASSTETPIVDVWRTLATGITPVNTPQHNVQLMPNPFSTETLLNVDQDMKSAEFRMYNALGEEVQAIHEISGTQIVIGRNNLSKGIYFYSLTEGQNLISRGKLVIE
jgi:hypothetical protein